MARSYIALHSEGQCRQDPASRRAETKLQLQLRLQLSATLTEAPKGVDEGHSSKLVMLALRS